MQNRRKIVSRSLAETHLLAGKFARSEMEKGSGVKAKVFGLYGDLGSGKTAFMQGAAKALGIQENVLSPTFVIQKSYSIPHSDRRLVHIDAYRLEDAFELARLGFDEIIKDSRNLIFIEWAERVKSLLPNETKGIYFKFIDENTREISFD